MSCMPCRQQRKDTKIKGRTLFWNPLILIIQIFTALKQLLQDHRYLITLIFNWKKNDDYFQVLYKFSESLRIIKAASSIISGGAFAFVFPFFFFFWIGKRKILLKIIANLSTLGMYCGSKCFCISYLLVCFMQVMTISELLFLFILLVTVS